MNKTQPIIKDSYQFGFHKPESSVFKTPRGLNRQVVEAISHFKNEPDWMRQFRLQALMTFEQKMMPPWGADLSGIDFDSMYYYISPSEKKFRDWKDVPKDIKDTYDKIGIPEAEKKFLAGVGAQYDSEVIYHNLKKQWEDKGVIFVDTDTALKKYPDLFRQYFGTVIPISDNKFAALNSAVWSGGSFVYVPAGVHVEIPLQAYFRINAANMGQFERTLIIAEEGSYVHYVEGCFLAGARVQTDKGEKLIEDISVGDKVLTHKGRYRSIYHIMKRHYRGKIFTIQYYGDSKAKLEVTEEHPLLVCKREKREYRNTHFSKQWLHADQVRKGDYLLYPILQKETQKEIIETETIRQTISLKRPFIYNYQPQISVDIPFGNGRHVSYRSLQIDLDPDFYRLVGYFLSEGHVDNEHYLTFTFHIKEKALLNDVRALVERYFAKDVIQGKIRNNGQTLTVCSTLASRFFAREFGMTNKTKHIPLWILESPQEHLKELIKGMWQGDGSYDTRRNLFRYSSVTKSLVTNFRDVLLKLGIIGSINSQERKSPKQTMHNVIISRVSNDSFAQIVNKKAINGRKEGSPFFINKEYLYLPIKSIFVEEKEAEVYNFSVSEDESYVAEGVISHNCTAPIYTTDSLHAAVVEIIVKKGARVRYTTIQNWSNNVYNLVTKRMIVEEEGIGEWIDGNLGCLQSGSTVTTPSGIKPIEDVSVGEKVLSYDEKKQKLCFKKVVNKKFSGLRKVYKISVGGRTLYATANHPLYSYIYDNNKSKKLKRYKLGYVRVDNLKQVILPKTSLAYGKSYKFVQPQSRIFFKTKNQYKEDLIVARDKKTRCIFPKVSNTEIMWLFGLFIGDGSIEKKTGVDEKNVRWAKVSFSVPIKDRAYAKLLTVMDKVMPQANIVERKDGIISTWCDVQLATFFEKNGFTSGALAKRIPEWIYSIPEEQRLAFIAGYLDSDGTLTVKRRKASIKSINESLINQCGKVLTTLGIHYSLTNEIGKEIVILGYKSIAKTAYRIEFALDERLLPFLSSQTQEKYKLIKRATKKFFFNVGRSIITLPTGLEIRDVTVSELSQTDVPTWDIEIKDTENFISEGFIVHNSKATMKYPSVYLTGKGAKGEVLSLALAGKGQHQDAGGKAFHFAPYTTSTITSKSVSLNGGRCSYRGMVKIVNGAKGSKSFVRCDALLLDELSRSDTYPVNIVNEEDVTLGHEASVSKVGEQQLFYLMSRRLSEAQSTSLIVNGFIEPIVKELPLEYAVELNRLINLSMEGSVG